MDQKGLEGEIQWIYFSTKQASFPCWEEFISTYVRCLIWKWILWGRQVLNTRVLECTIFFELRNSWLSDLSSRKIYFLHWWVFVIAVCSLLFLSSSWFSFPRRQTSWRLSFAWAYRAGWACLCPALMSDAETLVCKDFDGCYFSED